MKKHRIIVVGLVMWAMFGQMSRPVAGQAGNWGAYEAAVFQTADAVVRVISGTGNPADLEKLQQDAVQLETQFPIYGQQCPSSDACESTHYVLMMTQHVLTFPVDGALSVEDGNKLAFLKQATLEYSRSQGAQQAATNAATQTTSSSAQQPAQYLPIKVIYGYQPQGQGKPQQLTNGGVMRSGDRYKIIFQAEEPCYVYIFQADSSGKIYGLFPLSEFRGVRLSLKNPIQPGVTYYVPSEKQSFVLDQQTGAETIYLLAFRQPDQELEQLYQQIVAAQNQKNPQMQQAAKNVLLAKVRSKGPAKVVQDSTQTHDVAWDGQVYSLVRQRLEGMCNDCAVNTLTFTHR